MPISSLVHADTDAAYFLVRHVLAVPAHLDAHSLTLELGMSSTLARIGKEEIGRAEVRVWGEIDRAKMFARALGRWFEVEERIGEDQLGDMAARFGMTLRAEAEGGEGAEQVVGLGLKREVVQAKSVEAGMEGAMSRIQITEVVDV
jgi:hypothetical protein